MAASVEIVPIHNPISAGGPPVTGGGLTSISFKWADDDTIDTSNPIPIPLISSNYSWRKTFLLMITSPPSSDIQNLRFYTDGLPWDTNGKVKCFIQTNSAYYLAGTNDQGHSISGNSGANNFADTTTYNDSNTLLLNAGTVIGALTGAGDQPYIVMQILVSPGAPVGTISGNHYIAYEYDEI